MSSWSNASSSNSPVIDKEPLPYLHPRTPSFDGTINSTPIFSSPATPRDQPIRTFSTGLEKRIRMEDVEVDRPPGDGSASIVGDEKMDGDKTREEDLGIGSSKSVQGSPLPIPPEMMQDEGLPNVDDSLSDEEGEDSIVDDPESLLHRLDAMDADREGDGWAQRDTLAELLRKTLASASQMPFLRQQVEAQRETIRTLQQTAKISRTMINVERDRMRAERAGYRAELNALEAVRQKEIAAGTRPNKLLDLDVGYHQELEAANKRLEMDNRLMAPRLEDTQRQIDKLVTELRHLRSQVILNTEPLATADGALKNASPDKQAGLPSRATMGDARTEHLILAARKVRSMRMKDDRIGRLTLDELQRGGVVGPDGGVGYMEGYGETIEEEEEYDDEDSDLEEIKPNMETGRKGKFGTTPLLPRAKRSSKRSLPPPTTPRSKQASRPQTTTPGGSNFNDLLRAAEMATRPSTPTPPAGKVLPPSSITFSATRSTNHGMEPGLSERGSPVKRARRDPPPAWNETRLDEIRQEEPASEAGLDALDLLAQASQLDVAQSQDPDIELPPSQISGGSLAPAIDLRSSGLDPLENESEAAYGYDRGSSVVTATPQYRPRALSNASEMHTPSRRRESNDETPYPRYSPPSSVIRGERDFQPHDPPPGAYASPTGAAVPGLGKYVHLTSSMPARRMRSPYLKWSVEEDELLARAVALHGEKWDLVSKGVPTRSYHQVRQRWLRKTGAFDKKPQSQPSQTIKEEQIAEDDEDGSPTPTPGPGAQGAKVLTKKRKASQG